MVWKLISPLNTRFPAASAAAFLSFTVAYLLFLMAMYALSALLNLVHLRKRRKLDYIVVLGCGLNGSQVTPLLAGRIDRGIQLLRYNPNAKLILSGGQGPGEDVPEGVAMAAYAKEHGVEPERACGYVENIGREGTCAATCTIQELVHAKVNMFTTVFIGNSQSEIIGGKLVTKRGYRI